MRKIYLTVIILCLSTTVFYGQKIQLGFKAGVNVSSLDNEGSRFDIFESKTGFRVGGHLTLKLKGNLGLRTELLYSRDGAKFEGTDEQLDLNRLSFPILVKYSFAKIVNVELGPEFNFLLSSNPDGQFIGSNETLDYGASAGVEVKPIDKLGIGIRNYFGLKYHGETIFTENAADPGQVIETGRNNVFSVTLNYYLK